MTIQAGDAISQGRTALGVELGSTRIKAVLIGPDSAPLAVKLLKHGTLKTYPGLPHGLCTTHPDVVNPDLLAFFKG